jgi:hypothetical protein
MGTKRKVATWWQRRPHEFVVRPHKWKPKDGEIVFASKGQMLNFARTTGMVLKERIIHDTVRDHRRIGTADT